MVTNINLKTTINLLCLHVWNQLGRRKCLIINQLLPDTYIPGSENRLTYYKKLLGNISSNQWQQKKIWFCKSFFKSKMYWFLSFVNKQQPFRNLAQIERAHIVCYSQYCMLLYVIQKSTYCYAVIDSYFMLLFVVI